MRDKYYAVNRDSANYYATAQECINDLWSFVPPDDEMLDEENRVVVYKLPEGFGKYIDESDLSYDDIYMEFYNNKLYFSNGTIVNYKKPVKKEYVITGSDNKKYKVTAFNKAEAEKILRNYLRDKH